MFALFKDGKGENLLSRWKKIYVSDLPTMNIYTFIMLDTIDVSMFQLSYDTDGKGGYRIIKDNSNPKGQSFF